MKLARTNALIPLPTDPAEPIVGKEGYAAGLIDGVAYVHDDPAGSPFGVIVEAGDKQATLAVCAGGLAGTVRVKLGAAVTSVGRDLALVSTAQGCAFGPAPGTGARVILAQSLETGAIGELIEAVLFKPIEYAS